MDPSLFDTDTLSEFLKRRNAAVTAKAKVYLKQHGQFTFSEFTRFEIRRGYVDKRATRQLAKFDVFCAHSLLLPLEAPPQTTGGLLTTVRHRMKYSARGTTMADVSVLWRRLDQPGHEAVRLSPRGNGWQLTGTALFASDGRPCRLDYLVVCGPDWRTHFGRVTGWLGDASVEVEVAVEAGEWQLNGVHCPAVSGCPDLDLNFSPSTNLLAIRRLGLSVGAEAFVRAAWLRFPSFALEPLDQVYRRTGETTYLYKSADGSFVTDLRVNAAGFVTEYPGFWQMHLSLR